MDTGNQTNKRQDVGYGHVIKYTSLFGGVQGITILTNVIRNMISAKLLGPSGLALINIYNNITKFMGDSTNLGISFSAVKHVSEQYEEGNKEKAAEWVCTIRTWSVLTGLAGMLLTMALSPLLSRFMFKDSIYTSSIILLSPIVAMLAVMGGEMAVMKGMRMLKKVAWVSVLSALASLAICAPFYYSLKKDGIIPSLLLINLAILAAHLHYSTKLFPWHTRLFSLNSFLAGLPMVKVGVAYVLAGLFGQGCEIIIRAWMLDYGTLDDIGLYSSGYLMAISYAGVVFVAIEADYFPRLSAVCHDKSRMNATINQQIEVCVLLITPLLTIFVTAIPIIVEVLYGSRFADAEPMAVSASFYMFFKALALPVAYLALANGDSKMYLLTELICDVFMAVAVPLCFKQWGLTGAGFALSAGELLDLIIIHTFYRRAYGFRFSTRMLSLYLLQFTLLSTCVAMALAAPTALKWTVSPICVISSAIISFITIKKVRSRRIA